MAASKVLSVRVPLDLALWLDDYAGERGVKRQVVLAAALRSFRADTLGGVPELEPLKSTPRPSPAGREAKPEAGASPASPLSGPTRMRLRDVVVAQKGFRQQIPVERLRLERLISSGRALVGGVAVKDPDAVVDPASVVIVG